MSKSQRTKGHSFERQTAIAMRAIYPEAKRGLQSRGGTGEAPDVDGTPWFIECKVGAKPPHRRAWEQARDASDGRVPVAVIKQDRAETLAILEFSALLELWAELEALTQVDCEEGWK